LATDHPPNVLLPSHNYPCRPVAGLLGSLGSGAGEVAQEGDCVQIDRMRQAKQAQLADPNAIAILQAVAGTVDSK
jgi:hypothetical protein